MVLAPCQQSADHRCVGHFWTQLRPADQGLCLSGILSCQLVSLQGPGWLLSHARWVPWWARPGDGGLSRAPFPLPLPYFLQQGRGLLAEWVRVLRGREKGGLETDILPLPTYSTGPSSHRAAGNQEEGNRAYLSRRVMSNNLHAPLTRHTYLVPNMVLGFAKTDEENTPL